jgi:hypothetical protein
MMKHAMWRTLLIISLAGPSFTGRSEKLESIKPAEIWPNTEGIHINAHAGGVLWIKGNLIHHGRYHWFGQHMIADEAGNAAQVGIRVCSFRDLYNWPNEGVVLNVSSEPTSEIAKGCMLERPKVIYNRKTRKFVMWFHLELAGKGYGATRSGVAVADRVRGPYHYLGSFRPNAGAWPMNVHPDSCGWFCAGRFYRIAGEAIINLFSDKASQPVLAADKEQPLRLVYGVIAPRLLAIGRGKSKVVVAAKI